MPQGAHAGTAYVDVDGDLSSLHKRLGRLDKDRRFGKVGKKIGARLSVGIGAGLAGVAVAAKKSIDAASDLEESLNKTTATFEKSAPKIKRWSQTTADALGLTRAQALESAGAVGAMLKPMGVAPREAARMSKRMVQLAGDMASFNNEDPTEMLDRIRAGLSGESEPLKRFGTVLSEARVKQHAWKTGIADAGEELTEQEKILGRYSLLLKDTKDQHGDFARTSDGLANQQRILKARLGDLSAEVGKELLPAMTDATRIASNFIGEMRSGKGPGGDFARVVTDLADGAKDAAETVGPVLKDIGEFAVNHPNLVKASGAVGGIALGLKGISKLAGATGVTTLFRALGRGGSLTAKVGGLSKAKPVPVFVVNQAGMPGGGGGKVPGVISTVGKGALAAGTRLVPVIGAVGLIAYVADRNNKNLPTAGRGASSPSNPKGHVPFDPGAMSRRAPDRGTFRDESLSAAAAGAEELGKRVKQVRREIGRLKDGAVHDVDRLADETHDRFRRIKDSIGLHTREGRQLADRNLSGAVEAIGRSMHRGEVSTDRGMGAISDLMRDKSRDGKEGVRRNLGLAVDAIRGTMRQGGRVTKAGLEQIRALMVEQLKLYGLSPQQAVNIAKSGGGGFGDPDANRGREGGAFRQRGGLVAALRKGAIVPGEGAGDKVPLHIAGRLAAMVEPGELVSVANRNATAALMAVNKRVPRFASGGIVELLHPGNDPKGHGDHLHVAMLRGIVALGRRLQKMGWLVGEHPAFGGVGGHTAGSYHYRGQAIDVNWPDAGAEAAKIRALLPLLGGNLAAAAPKLKRLLVGGPDSPLKALAQRALDLTRTGAQHRLDSVSGMSFEGAESAGGQFGKAALKRLWVRAGGNPAVANLMAAIALAESGGNPNARNPSGASGLWQILGVPFPGDVFDPLTNARMAVSKYQSQGLGAWEAYTRGMHTQYLQRGGLVKGIGRAIRRKSPRLRRSAVTKLLDRVKGVGLPGKLTGSLKSLAKDSDVFGEFADRAGQLSTEDANGNPIPGQVGGLTQADWLTRQLEALFKWRNELVRAREIVADRLAKIKAALAVAMLSRRSIATRIRVLGRHPKRHRKLLRTLRPQLRALTDRIIPGLRDRRGALSSLAGGLGDSLADVQGIGGPRDVLATMPSDIGALGGRIFDARLQLRDLNAPTPRITDTGGSAGPDTSERDSLLAEIGRQVVARSAVKRIQDAVLADLPPFGGSFAEGGVVPGPVGAARTVIAHGGETITPPDGGGSRVPEVHLHFASGTEWLRKFVRVEVQDGMRRESRTAGRGLPSRGGLR